MKDNALYNLQALPKSFHNIFTKIQEAKGLEDKLKYARTKQFMIDEYGLNTYAFGYYIENEEAYVKILQHYEGVEAYFWDTPLKPMTFNERHYSNKIISVTIANFSKEYFILREGF